MSPAYVDWTQSSLEPQPKPLATFLHELARLFGGCALVHVYLYRSPDPEKPMIRISFALAALVASATPLAAQTITGRASVIDGDTLEIRGTRIRLHAVDAPENAQTCQGSDGKAYRCGQQAALALSDKIGTASVSCEQKDVDRYNRIVAVCSIKGEDLNARLVGQGHALAYRQYGTDYVPQENKARSAKRGIWAGTFTPPWDWRKGTR